MKAVVFVDVQNDFVSGKLGNEWAQNVTPKIVQYAKSVCQDRSCRVYATLDTHRATQIVPGNSERESRRVGYLTTLEGRLLPVEHCVEGSDGWNVVPELMDVIVGRCTFVPKPTFGSYDLGECIAEDIQNIANANKGCLGDWSNITEIELLGFCTSICVLANAVLLRARFPNMYISVLSDLCADVSKENHQAAIQVLKAQQISIS